MKTHTFSKTSLLQAPLVEAFSWHERPGALERLVPPWDPLSIISSSGTIQNGAERILKMHIGPFPYRWHARHQGYEKNRQFQDIQVKGPLKYWCHSHEFKPRVDNRSCCYLIDTIEYKLPFSPFGDLLIHNRVQNNLKRIFNYRHTVLNRDLKLHLRYGQKPLRILITGGNGIIGSNLIPFLTTGGHRVIRLVRDRSQVSQDTIFWEPTKGAIDLKRLENMDVAIHLGGESLGNGYWSVEKKEKISQSRIAGTRLLVDSFARLSAKPKVLLSASAIGFYGDRGEEELEESAAYGNDFISSVCQQWEAEAIKAESLGIRTCLLRIGVVLTPLGGALSKVLLPFRLGFGAKFGTGRQFLSWVSIEDVIGAIYFLMHRPQSSGPYNIVSPTPVRNLEYCRVLNACLNRKRLITLPSRMIRILFGQMGKEIILAGTRVYPERLTKEGYQFHQVSLKEHLEEQLGLA